MFRSVFIFSFFSVFFITFTSASAVVIWDGGGGDPNWNTPQNWSTDQVPNDIDVVRLGSPSSVIIESPFAAEVKQLIVGNGGDSVASLTLSGGALSLHRDVGATLIIGQANSRGEVNISGGHITLLGDLAFVGCGFRDKGTINITDGVLDCGSQLRVGSFYNDSENPDSNGVINLDGGTIETGQLIMVGSGRIDIEAGMLIVDGNAVEVIGDYVSNSWITADNGTGQIVIDYDIRNSGKTTVTATSNNAGLPALTIAVEPNDIGIDSVIPAVNEPVHYWQDKSFAIGAGPFAKCPYVYRFEYWQGDVADPCSASTTVIMDTNESITAFFVADERRCGDECHPILQGDLNEDCYIDFEDFAIYAAKWMYCTDPNCDSI